MALQALRLAHCIGEDLSRRLTKNLMEDGTDNVTETLESVLHSVRQLSNWSARSDWSCLSVADSLLALSCRHGKMQKLRIADAPDKFNSFEQVGIC